MKEKVFKTKRELEWYIQGMKDARKSMRDSIYLNISRYESAFNHMDFDKDGKTLDSSVQPSFIIDVHNFTNKLLGNKKEEDD